MTMQDYTALLFIVDRSGSMHSIASDMEGAIQTLLDEQRKLPGKLTVDYVRFDNVVEYVQKFADPDKAEIRIEPRNMTALLDAIGTGINTFGEALAALPEDERPAKVLVAIVTDGLENASRDFTGARIEEMVKHQTDAYGWDFVYLGANQDAITVARELGIGAQSAMTYNSTHAGTVAMGSSLSSYMTGLRTTGKAEFTDADREAAKR